MTSWLDAIHSGATLLTPNRRLAQHLRRQFHARQQAAGLQCWDTPDILPWGAWLQRTWRGWWEAGLFAADDARPLLLEGAQERLLWQRLIEADLPEEMRLLQPAPTARLAREAWQLLHAWQLPLAAVRRHAGPDGEAFLRWAEDFAQRCASQGWLDAARLPATLTAACAAGEVKPPAQLLLYGFEELDPAQQTLCDALAAQGGTVHRVESMVGRASARQSPNVGLKPDPQGRRLPLADAQEEIRTAARWARYWLEVEGGAVGVVVPDLAERRGEVERLFLEVFHPGVAAPPQPAFNLSLGRPLADWPVVHAALLVLNIVTQRTFPVDEAGHLLRSPFLGGAEQEAAGRARADALLRQRGALSIGLGDLCRAVEAACPALFQRLLELDEGRWRGRRAYGQWAQAWASTLAGLGWPGERALDSGEYQAVQALHEVFAGLARLDGVAAPVEAGEALAALRQQVREAVFQPQAPETPVQVLGLLEAAGLEFDHLWVCGLHDGAWPPAPRPNPFLPAALQRSHGLPHASAERELAFARRLTERLAASAPDVVFSHPCRAGDEELRPSPLIAALPAVEAAALPLAPAAEYSAQIQASAVLESLADDTAPPFAASKAPGGTRLFADQIACPFRACARHRLGAEGLAQPAFGPDALLRGQLVHGVLERVWGALGDSAALAGLDAAAEQALVGRAVAAVLEDARRTRPRLFTPHFLALETERLTALTMDWLALERERPPFVVEGREVREQLQVGGLTVDGRLDRVDRLEDGTRLILDYKTGEAKWGDWKGARPREPQLPLYAAFGNQPEVGGVVYARLKAGQLGFSGLAAQEGLVPGLAHCADAKVRAELGDWETVLASWRQGLAAVAAEFRAGQAAVAPLKKACDHCDLDLLCRIHEQADGRAEAEEGEVGDD